MQKEQMRSLVWNLKNSLSSRILFKLINTSNFHLIQKQILWLLQGFESRHYFFCSHCAFHDEKVKNSSSYGAKENNFDKLGLKESVKTWGKFSFTKNSQKLC